MARKDTYKVLADSWNEHANKTPLTERQRTWVIEHVHPTQRIELKKKTYCSDCGGIVKDPKAKVCPHCGRPFKGEPWKIERSHSTMDYFCLSSAWKDDTQAMRFFAVFRDVAMGRKATYRIEEVARELITPKGDTYYYRLYLRPFPSYYYDNWMYGSRIHFVSSHKFSTGSKEYYRQSLYCTATKVTSVAKTLHRNGLRTMRNSNYPVDVAVKLLTDNYYETLWKTGQTALVNYLICKSGYVPQEMKEALKICQRHGYRIKDYTLYKDYLTLLDYFHLDLHNPHYICPKNLKREHDRLMERHDVVEERRRAEEAAQREQERIERDKKHAEMVAHWPELMGSLLSLSLSGKNLFVRPLQSIEEFKEEGKAMKHCVYACGYYDINAHPYTLILSAKDSAGKRLATIEYNTQRHSIVQCRAACNQVPERDKEIRQLITDHRKDIEELLKVREVATKGTKKSEKQTVAIAA